jgi:hypothetical protein
MSVNNDALIKFEMEALKADIITFIMQVVKEHLVNLKGFRTKLWTKCSYTGYVYLAGRVAGKQPPTAPMKLG